MDVVTSTTLAELLEPGPAPALSLFVPTAPHWDGGRALIQFRNLLREAGEVARSEGFSDADIASVVAPLEQLADDQPWWAAGATGVAAFSRPGQHDAHRLPASFAPMCRVGAAFAVAPLVPIAARAETFFVLALSPKVVRVLKATEFDVEEVELGEHVPASLEDALPYDDPEPQLQLHQTGGGAGSAMFHGHGAGKDVRSARLRRFLRIVDDGVPALVDTQRPLVVAGLAANVAEYRSLSHHPTLIEAPIGSPDRMSVTDLHAATVPLAVEWFTARREAELKSIADGGRPVAFGVAELAEAAPIGRIDTLFLSEAALNGGTSGDPAQDPIEQLIAETSKHGGRVVPAPSGTIDDEAAAVLRY